MFKKFVTIATGCAMLFSAFSVAAFAQESTDSWEIAECGDTLQANYSSTLQLPNAEPCWEDNLVASRAASIQVNIQSPLEQSWRNTYSSDYYYQADRVVERIDDYLYSQFGIDFYSVAQPNWSTSKTVSSDILQDVTNNIGKGSADLMIAFAGPIADTSQYSYFGIAYVGHPYAVVYDHNYNQNCKSAQHEVGHTYGLSHCENTCVMKQGWDTSWTLFEHLCSTHKTQWSNAKNKY